MKYLDHKITLLQHIKGKWYCWIRGPGRIIETQALKGGRFANLLYACRCLKAEKAERKPRQ